MLQENLQERIEKDSDNKKKCIYDDKNLDDKYASLSEIYWKSKSTSCLKNN